MVATCSRMFSFITIIVTPMNVIFRIVFRADYYAVAAALLLVWTVMLTPSTLIYAQYYKSGDVVDRIVAVVGNEIVMQSDVAAYMLRAMQQDRRMNPNDPKVQKQMLDMLINERLVVIKAIEDSLTASDDEINERLDYQIAMMRQQFGSEKRIEEVYGMPISSIKREFRDEVRKQVLSEKISQQKFANVKVSAKDVQAFYQEFKDSLPSVPPQYELYHIVKYVEASESAKEQVLALAQKVRDSLVNGGKFADFAKRYSGDPGSKDVGGELGMVNRGNFIAEFEKAAYALQPGEISLPVESPFGFHVIQLIEKQENAVNTRHILFKIGQTKDDADRAIAFLDSLRARVKKGESFEDLAKAYSDDAETKPFGGSLGRIEASKLPPDMKSKVDRLSDGDITEPAVFNAPNTTKVAYHIVLRKKFIPEHPISPIEDYKRLEQMATMHKRSKMYEEWMNELRKTIFWEVKAAKK